MRKESQYKTIEELLNIVRFRNNLNSHEVKLLENNNPLKICLGVGCLVVAVVPNGLGLFMYPLGFMLLGIDLNTILKTKENLSLKLWLRLHK